MKSLLVVTAIFLITMTNVVMANEPVQLTFLYVKAGLENEQVHICWATEKESNTFKFDIEHSTDGRNFENIGRLAAADDSLLTNMYNWLQSPAPGLNYYRIKAIDKDGKFSYSQTISLLYAKGLTKTMASPNPVSGCVTLALAAPASKCQLNIVNATGKSVLQLKIPDNVTEQTLDFSSYPVGVYFVKLRANTMTEMIRIIKR